MGVFALECSGTSIDVPPGAQRLSAFLALQARPIARSCAAGTLWPEASSERADGNLRSALWRLRKSGADVVNCRSSSCLALDSSVDVDLRTLLADARDYCSRCAAGAALQQLLSEELLPDWHDTWLVTARERVRQLRLQMIELRARQLLELGEPGRAVDLALTAVAIEPMREAPRELLIRAHLQEGNICEAIREFRRFSALLYAELGIMPSVSLRALIKRNLRQRVASLADSPK